LEEAMPPSVYQIRASLTVLLAKAVKDIFPKMELIQGVVTDHFFVYDIYTSEQEIDSHALARIEERMLELLREGVVIKNVQMLRENAADYFVHKGQYIKAALAVRAKTELLDLVQVDDLLDLVDRPGSTEVSDLKFFRLIKSESATKSYPSSDTINVQQIVGTAFHTKSELKYFLKRLGSVQFVDHQKLGQKMGLFYFDEGVYWLKRGMIVKESISKIVEEVYRKGGYDLVQVPGVTSEKSDLITKLFVNLVIEKGRIAEISYNVNDECDVGMMGLWRSTHYFADQFYNFVNDQDLSQTLTSSLQMITEIVNMFASGYQWVVCRAEAGTVKRIPGHEKALTDLTNALDTCDIDYSYEEVDGEYTGPRAYLCLPDMYGKYWKCSYVGINLRSLPQNEVKKGKPHPVKSEFWLVEGSLFGSFDRLIAYLIELHQGCLPFLLSPEQVRVISQRETSNAYAEEIVFQMRSLGLRVSVDLSDDKLGAKIHRAESEYVSTIVVVGDQEAQNQTIALRAKTADEKMLNIKLESFLEGFC